MTIEVHCPSALLGALLFGLVLLTVGGARVSRSAVASSPVAPTSVTVAGIPTPGQLVRLAKLDGDLPYLVPAGKVLTITRAGLKGGACNDIPQSVLGVERITFDGNCVWAFYHGLSGGSLPFTYGTDLGHGIAVHSGVVVDVSGQPPADGQAVILLGYLSDESPPPPLDADVSLLTLASGGTQSFALSAGATHGLGLYLLLGSATGTTPGIPADNGLTIPLNLDNYYVFTALHPNTALLASSLGFLDAQGQGQASFNLPPGLSPTLAGATLNLAYVVLDFLSSPPETVFASNAVPVTFVP